jgi:predicted ester cyclase
VDQDEPVNELLSYDPPAKLINTFKETFAEAREAFPDLHVTVEDLVAEGDRLTARVTMRGTHQGAFQGLTPTGKRVEGCAIDMFRISDGKIVEHWGYADDPTDFLRAGGAPEHPRNQLPRSPTDRGKKKGREHAEAPSLVTPSASCPARPASRRSCGFGGTEKANRTLDLLWRAYVRRFDLEHIIRFLKQTLGWTTPRVRHPEQADRWTWLVLLAYAQLGLARSWADNCRLPWERPQRGRRLTPCRTLRDFAALLAAVALRRGHRNPAGGRRAGPKGASRAGLSVTRNSRKPLEPTKKARGGVSRRM